MFEDCVYFPISQLSDWIFVFEIWNLNSAISISYVYNMLINPHSDALYSKSLLY